MKKIITLVLGLGIFVCSFAQHRDNGNYDDRNSSYGQTDSYRYNDNRNITSNTGERERLHQIASINREYDHKIRSVRSSWFMRGGEKARKIRSLEIERDYQIRLVNERFYRNMHRHDRNRW